MGNYWASVTRPNGSFKRKREMGNSIEHYWVK